MLTQVKTTHEVFHQPQRIQVPLFQRRYVWNENEQWSPLLDDLLLIAEVLLQGKEAKPHFLGAIVLQQRAHEIDGLPTRIVIDGQQRLTTLQILINALYQCSKEVGLEDVSLRLQDLVFNPKHYAKNMSDQIKLTPTNRDRHIFQKVLSENASPAESETVSNNIESANSFFHFAFKSWINFDSDQNSPNATVVRSRAEALANAVSYFFNFVVIDLAMDDDAQMIFETLNARGTPLSPADLIKNLLFQKIEKQSDASELHEKYWEPLENEFWEKEISSGRMSYPRLSLFINQWLISKLHKEITYRRLFSEFRKYLDSRGTDIRELLKDIYENARIYENAHLRSYIPEGDLSAVEIFVYRLNNLESDVFKPLLIWLLDSSREKVPLEEIQKFTSSLESWMVRRVATKANTKNYNKFMVELLKNLESSDRLKAGSVLEELLAKQTSYLSHWPSDKEVTHVLKTYPLGWRITRARLRVILEAIEDSLRGWGNETTVHEQRMRRYSSTVEHIMPKAWEKNWNSVANDSERKFRDNMIQTLGNFTLASRRLNSRLSNGPWEVKRQALADAQLTSLALNKDVVSEPEWNESKIEERTLRLVEEFIRYWPVPNDKLPKDFKSPNLEVTKLSESESRVGERWSLAEESALQEEWSQGLSIEEISGLHQRRTGGIMVRLKTLDLLAEEATIEDADRIQSGKSETVRSESTLGPSERSM